MFSPASIDEAILRSVDYHEGKHSTILEQNENETNLIRLR